jgi:hypothetical protein
MKQNFVCIGAQKAGIIMLADILSAHNDICIPPIKETKYFLFDADYNKRKSFYDSYFSNYTNQKAIGEFDPDYLLFPFTAKRIYDTLGADVKIIVVLRNPADRAYSHYLMTKRKGLEPNDFEAALKAEAGRKGDIKTQKIYAYAERGFYGNQLQQFLNVFAPENFLFLVFEEDFLKNKQATIEKVQQFLGVTPQALNLDLHSNEAGEAKNEALNELVRKPNFVKRVLKAILPSKSFRKGVRKMFIKQNMQKVSTPKLSAEQKQTIITSYFAEDIKLTEKLINRDLSVWYK